MGGGSYRVVGAKFDFLRIFLVFMEPVSF
jgi:hypothetical protein